MTASYARTHQFAQSLRNPESVAGPVFPADLFVGAGSERIPVARADQGVLAGEWLPTPGLRVGAQAYLRGMDGLVVAAPADDGPFAAGPFATASGTSRGASFEAAFHGSRYALALDYGWQRTRLETAAGEFAPSYATTHRMDAGVRFFPSPTSSVRLALAGAAGRRASGVNGALEWEACNLLDRGCEFSGSPGVSGDRGGLALPAYLRIDAGASKHWHVSLPGRDATIGVSFTVSNVLGRRNLLTYAADPGTGERTAIEMLPRAPLILAIDWRF
jgi:hypothetical protein